MHSLQLSASHYKLNLFYIPTESCYFSWPTFIWSHLYYIIYQNFYDRVHHKRMI